MPPPRRANSPTILKLIILFHRIYLQSQLKMATDKSLDAFTALGKSFREPAKKKKHRADNKSRSATTSSPNTLRSSSAPGQGSPTGLRSIAAAIASAVSYYAAAFLLPAIALATQFSTLPWKSGDKYTMPVDQRVSFDAFLYLMQEFVSRRPVR